MRSSENLSSAGQQVYNHTIAWTLRYGLLLFVVLTLVPTGAALIWLSFEAQQRQLIVVQRERSWAAAGEIDSYLNDLQRKLSYLSRVRGLADESRDVQLRLLDALSRHDTAYETLAIADRQGNLVTAVSPYGLPIWPTAADLPEFRRALDGGEEVIGQVTSDPSSDLTLVVFAVPLRNRSDQIAGVLLARVNLEFLWFVVARTTVGETGYVYVLDQRNHLIAERDSSPQTFQLRDLSALDSVRRLTNPDAQPATSYIGLYGAQVIGAAAIVPIAGWHVVVELPTAEAQAPLRQMLSIMAGALLLALLLAVTCGIAFARRIIRPLQQLTGAAARMSTGDLQTEVRVERHDELGLLAATFNEMTARLRYLFDALNESQSRFRAIFDQTFQFIGLLSPDGRVLEVNQTALDFVGLQRSDVVGRLFWELPARRFSPAVRTRMRAAVAEAAQGKFVRFELELRSTEGAYVAVDFSLKPIHDAEGQVTMLIPEGRDITEQKQLERLHADLKFSRSITAATPDLIYVYDLVKNRNVYVNRDTVPILEIEAGEVERLADRLLPQIMHPDDLAGVPEHIGRMMQLDDGAVIEREYRLRSSSGAWRWVLGREVIFARSDDGTPSQVLGVVQDITAHKQAVETMQLLAEVGNLLATSLDYEATVAGVAQIVVPRFADFCTVHILGEDGSLHEIAVAHRDPSYVAKIHELTRRYPLDPDHPIGLPEVVRSGRLELVPVIDDSRLARFIRDPEHLMLLQELQLGSSICIPLIARGRTLGAVSFYLTTSGRRYSADNLPVAEQLAGRAALAIDNARLYHEAKAAVRARDHFLSIASHELKTPLTSMIGYTELLRRRTDQQGGMSDRDRRAIQVIGEQAGRLNRMVSSLLDLSRIQTGQLSISPQPLDLCTLVRRVVEDIQPTLDTHEVELHCQVERLLVEGDELRLFQVLQNIISNAIKYSPAGGTIAISIEPQGLHARIAISDQGIGIPASVLPNLFSRFYRVPNGDQERIAGMGLGLFVVKEIVTLHGGTVEVQSREGQGSTFTVSLPLIAEMSLGENRLRARQIE